jgi:SpoVK/Ycf46/Vps4 family AAA+-type ATPase
LVALVHEATLIALRQRIEHQNASIDSLNRDHFEEAMKRIMPSVKAEDREHYKKLKKKFHSEILNANNIS